MTSSADAAVRTIAVDKSYGRSVALVGTSVGVPFGITGLLGPNGAGKTTLISIMSTAIRADAGALDVMGCRVDSRRSVLWARGQIGVLPQAFGYYPGFTVEEFVEYVAWLKGVPRRGRRGAVRIAVDRVGLADHLGTKMKALSGGMLRRAGVAQAIVNAPSVVLLDEPTAGLDLEQKVAFRRLIAELGRSSAVLLSTHAADDVATMCDRVVVLSKASVRFDGTLTEFTARASRTLDPTVGSAVEQSYLAVLAGGS